MQMALEDHPWRISTVGSAEEALPLVRAGGVDLILLDKNLPGMSGTELLRQVRSEDRRTLIVLLTGYASTENARECMRLGVDGYLEKPFEDIFAVVEYITQLLRRAGCLDTHQPSPPPMSRGALVALPDPGERTLITTWLRGRVDAISQAATLAELWRVLGDTRPSLVIADLALAGFEPQDLIDDIRRVGQDVFIVVVALHPSRATLTTLINSNVRVVLERPLRENDLDAQLKHVVDRF